MENSCLYEIRWLRGPQNSKSEIVDDIPLFLLNQVFRRFTEFKIGNLRWKTAAIYEIRCIGGSESLKSAILDGKQLFLSNQVFRRSRELKIGYFGLKTAVL